MGSIVSIYQPEETDVLGTTKVQHEKGILSFNTTLSEPVIYHKTIEVLLAFSQNIDSLVTRARVGFISDGRGTPASCNKDDQLVTVVTCVSVKKYSDSYKWLTVVRLVSVQTFVSLLIIVTVVPMVGSSQQVGL